MKYAALKAVNEVFKKIGKTTVILDRWEMARRIAGLRKVMEPLEVAEELPSEMVQYTNQHRGLLERYGKRMSEFDGSGGKFIKFDVSARQAEFDEEMAKLNEEFKDALAKEDGRMSELRTLYEKDVPVEIEKIEYEWCGGYIDANELSLLVEHDLVLPPKKVEPKKGT